MTEFDFSTGSQVFHEDWDSKIGLKSFTTYSVGLKEMPHNLPHKMPSINDNRTLRPPHVLSLCFLDDCHPILPFYLPTNRTILTESSEPLHHRTEEEARRLLDHRLE